MLSSLHQQVVKKDERTLPHSYRRPDKVGSTAYINQTGPSSNRKFTNSKPTGSDKGKRIRRAEVETKVAFTAGLSHSILHAGEHQNIVFNYVETNIGGGYNPHHGVFIAPVTGTYVFYTSVMADNRAIFCQIVVNGVRKVTAYAIGTATYYDQGSQAVVVQLQKGDDVAVQNFTPDDAIFSNSDIYTTFSGFLLYQG